MKRYSATRCPWRRRPGFRDGLVHSQLLDLAQPPNLLIDRLPFDVAFGDRVLLDLTGPPVEKIRPDAQVVGDLGDRPSAAVAHHPHRVAPEFFRVLLPLLRHGPDSGSIVAPFGVRKIGSTPQTCSLWHVALLGDPERHAHSAMSHVTQIRSDMLCVIVGPHSGPMVESARIRREDRVRGGDLVVCRQVAGIAKTALSTDLTTTINGLPYGMTAECASCASTCRAAVSRRHVSGRSRHLRPLRELPGACKGDPACRSRCTIDTTRSLRSARPRSRPSAPASLRMTP